MMLEFSISRRVTYLKWIHTIQAVLFLTIFVLGCSRAATKHGTVTRADTWIIVVSLKSMIVLAYQVSSDNVTRLHRFASLRTNMILNIIESIFWVAAIVITGLSIGGCSQTSGACALSGVIIVIAIGLM
ncbi:hypothetical protein JCM24511_08752 [Saitozyma sp. JCM 24511]|nr:hypothetical protein JCM24511_08752 [Saitozyma sp. JCM 24511]